MRKIVSVLLICGLILSCTGCGKKKVVLTTGFGKDQVFIINNDVTTLPEMMVYLTNVQNQYEAVYGMEIWNASLEDVTLEENIKDTVLARAARIETMYLMALSLELEIDESDNEKLQSIAQKYYDSLNETEITSMGITQEMIFTMYQKYALANMAYDDLVKDINPEISDDEARTVKVEHIFLATSIKNGAGTVVEYSMTERANVFEKAQMVRELALEEPQSFLSLAQEYSDDDTITLTFGKGVMDSRIEEAAFLLQTGEISPIIETDSGYHILKCISTLDREETESNKSLIVERMKEEAFESKYDEFVHSLVRNLNEELWDSVTLIHDENVNTSDFFAVYDEAFATAND